MLYSSRFGLRYSVTGALLVLASIGASACSSDEAGSGGEGTVEFTIWGEEYIEDGIPSSEFEDGWSVEFDKFLIVVGNVQVADSDAGTGATLADAMLFDLAQKGPHEVGTTSSVAARSWNDVGYSLIPASTDTSVVAPASPDDLTFLGGQYSLYVSGTATNGEQTKTFAWAFADETTYSRCVQVDDSGNTVREGIVVGDGTRETVQLTIHGDHFFYDSLGEDAVLRFAPLAGADDAGDGDGEITMEELESVQLNTIDVGTDDPRYVSSEDNLADFLGEVIKTLGHFRGEGHCDNS